MLYEDGDGYEVVWAVALRVSPTLVAYSTTKRKVVGGSRMDVILHQTSQSLGLTPISRVKLQRMSSQRMSSQYRRMTTMYLPFILL